MAGLAFQLGFWNYIHIRLRPSLLYHYSLVEYGLVDAKDLKTQSLGSLDTVFEQRQHGIVFEHQGGTLIASPALTNIDLLIVDLG